MAEFIKDPKLCAKCGVDGCVLKCPCKQVMYCGKTCQKHDWALHKTNCRAILDKKVRQAKKEHGRDDVSVAQARTNAGDAHFMEGRYAEAENCYLEAHRIDLQAYGADNPIVVGHMRQLGQLYIGMGRHEKAKMMLEESLAISRRTVGEKSRAVAEALHYMSMLMGSMGDFQGGLKKLEEARVIFEDIPGNHHERITHIDSQIAIYRQRAEMLQSAHDGGLQGLQESEATQNNIKTQLEALRALRAARKNDTDGEDVVDLLLNVGTAYGSAGKEVEARAHYEEALGIIRRLHGDKHPHVANVLENIAKSLARGSVFGVQASDVDGHLDEANKIFEKVLKIRIRVNGEDSEPVADTLISMGTFSMERGKTSDAIQRMEQAIGILTRVRGRDHQKIALAHYLLMKLKVQEGDWDAALVHCEESVRMYKELGFGQESVLLQAPQEALVMLQYRFAMCADVDLHGPD